MFYRLIVPDKALRRIGRVKWSAHEIMTAIQLMMDRYRETIAEEVYRQNPLLKRLNAQAAR